MKNCLMKALVAALAAAWVNLALAEEAAPKAVEADADDFLRPMTRYVDEWCAVERTELNKLWQEMWT